MSLIYMNFFAVESQNCEPLKYLSSKSEPARHMLHVLL